MPKASKEYNEFLVKQLKDPELAAAYLNEHFQYEGPNSKELLMNGFRLVLEAQGFTNASKKSGISRRALYKSFSEKGNPTLDTLFALLTTIGLELRFSAPEKKRKTRKIKAA